MARFVKGQPRPANAGRKSWKVVRATVIETCERLSCNPLAGMIELAQDKKTKPELRGRMYAEIAKYVYPQKRSVETRYVDEDGRDKDVLNLDAVRAYMSEKRAPMSTPDPDDEPAA